MPRETPAQERYYQQMQEARKKQPQETFYMEQRREEYKAPAPTPTPPAPEYEPLPETGPEFYEAIGYPEYAEKYEAFKVPKGYTVSKIEPKEEELQITLEPKYEAPYPMPTPTTYAEMRKTEYKMYHYIAPTLISVRAAGLPRLSDILFGEAEEAGKQPAYFGLPSPQRTAASLQVLGGIVEAGERYAEIIAPYPVPIPERPVTPARVTGLVAGTLAASAVAGWVLEPGITPAAQHYLTKKYLEKGPLEWAGLKEKAVMKLTGARPYVTPGVVSAPTGAIIPSHEVYTEIWEWGLTPKQSLLFTEKAMAETTKELPKFFIRGTAMVPMALKQMEAVYKPMPYGYAEPWTKVPSPIAGGLPQPQITELTKPFMGAKLPFIPTIEPIGLTSTRLAQVLGIGTVLGLAGVPKAKQREKLEALPLVSPITAQILELPSLSKTEMQNIVGLAPIQATKQEQKQMQKQLQKTIQAQTQAYTYPTRQLQRTQFPTVEDIRKSYQKRGKKAALDLWGRYPRQYPLATAKQVLKMVTGK